MTYPFAALKRLRDKLASIPSALVDAPTRAEIVKAIDELDDAMVIEKRAEYAGVPFSVQLANEQTGFIHYTGTSIPS